MFNKLKYFHKHIKLGKNVKFENDKHIIMGTNLFVGDFSVLSGFGGGNLELGKNVRIHSFCKVATCGGNMFIGDNVQIGDHCTITAQGDVTIESDVLMADKINIIANQHSFHDITKPIMDQGCTSKKILIKKGAWIGINATILSGVTIGQNSVVGANAVVTKDVPDFSVVVGVPAHVVNKYDFQSGNWIR